MRNISNNIGSFTSAGATAAIAGGVRGINVSGAAASMTISGNNIGNATTDNMRGGVSGTTTGNSIGIGINITTAPVLMTVTGNIIKNITTYGTGIGSSVRGIFAQTSTENGALISNNTISNLTTNSGLTSFSAGTASACGIFLVSGLNSVVSQNTIHTISNTTVATTEIYVVGISCLNATNTTITRNTIYNLINTGTSTTVTTPAVVAGIAVCSGTTVININNNMISLGNGQATNTAFIGIMAQNGSTPDPIQNIYHNSINIEGTVTTGAQPSFGIARTDFSTTARTAAVDIKNNIITNTRTGGTGKHYAIANNYGATTPTATGWTSNNNVLNATPATIGFWTADKDFANWQTTAVSDANSLSGVMINYTNTAIADLHITGTTTPIESTGVNIASVSVDYDGQTRNTLSPTDIGADAGNFISYPIINYTALTNTCTAGVRTLTATITDVDGVPTTGAGLPVLYWKINAGAYAPVTAVSLGANLYEFSLGTGSIVNDVISYYIVAQDNLGNVGSSPSLGATGFTTSPPAAATPPTTPNSYMVSPTLNGTYTVGTTGYFATLAAAVSAYNISCITGPVVFSLLDASYSETYPISINENIYASAINTLTIKPATGVVSTITGSNNGASIIINGLDYVTIDGSNSGANAVATLVGGNAAIRNLTIQNTNIGTAAAVISVQSGTAGAMNNVIKNVNVVGQDPLTTLIGISLGGNAVGTAGTDNDNNQVVNCSVQKAIFGIYSVGRNATNQNTGTIIKHNDLSATGANRIRRVGILMLNDNGALVSHNHIGGIHSDEGSDAIGIAMGAQGIFATFTTAGGINNALITNNKINGVINDNTYSAAGIVIAGAVGAANTITNNMISGVISDGNSGDLTAGIFVTGSVGSITNVYHNTVSLDGDKNLLLTPGAGMLPSFGIAISGTDPTVDVRNNILSNSQTADVALNVNAKAYALGMTTATFSNLTSNYNDFITSGPQAGSIVRSGSLATAAGINYATVIAWNTASTKDANSLKVAPTFTSATDLHLPYATNMTLNAYGTPIATVLTDYDGATRDTATPDMGADEFCDTPAAPTGTAAQSFCNSATVANLVATGTAIQWYAAATGGTPLASTTALVSGNHYFASQTISGCESTSRFEVTVTVNSINTIVLSSAVGTDNQTVNAGNSIINITYSTTGATGATVTGLPSGLTATWAGNTVTISGSVSGCSVINYTVTLIGGCGIVTATGTITVVASTIPTFTISPTTINAGGTITLPTTSDNGITGTWSPAINNCATTTYTFTPTTGQCATTTTVTITVTPGTAPTGTAAQTFCTGETVGQIVATGTGIVWYDMATGGTVVPNATLLVSGTTYYASQTVSGCESPTRLAVTMTTGSCLGTNEFDITSFRYYPNPTTDILNISYSETLTSIKVTNMLGQHIFTKTVNATETTIDMSNLPTGTYFVEVVADKASKVVKVIKK